MRKMFIKSLKNYFLKARITWNSRQLFLLNSLLLLLNFIKMTSNFSYTTNINSLIYYCILLGISFPFPSNCNPISFEILSRFRPREISSQPNPSALVKRIDISPKNDMIKVFVDNLWFLDTDFAIAFTLLLHDGNI